MFHFIPGLTNDLSIHAISFLDVNARFRSCCINKKWKDYVKQTPLSGLYCLPNLPKSIPIIQSIGHLIKHLRILLDHHNWYDEENDEWMSWENSDYDTYPLDNLQHFTNLQALLIHNENSWSAGPMMHDTLVRRHVHKLITINQSSVTYLSLESTILGHGFK